MTKIIREPNSEPGAEDAFVEDMESVSAGENSGSSFLDDFIRRCRESGPIRDDQEGDGQVEG